MATYKKMTDIEGNGFRNLLVLLLIYIVGSPFLEPYPSLFILAHLSLSIAMFVTIYTVQKYQQERSFAIALLLPLLIL